MMDKVQFYFSNKRSIKVNTQSFTIQVRSDYSTINIHLREIVFIETLDDYVKINLHGKKPILTLMSLKSMLYKLPENDFVRVHRSYV
jgi:two-component system, LytTR family, response regulator